MQLAQLLQMNKTKMEDVDLIRNSCSKLNTLQIQKILTMYSPGEGEVELFDIVVFSSSSVYCAYPAAKLDVNVAQHSAVYSVCNVTSAPIAS